MLIDIHTELFITDFVAFFILPVIWEILLHGVVGEMDASGILSQGVLVGRGPDVSVFVPISFDDSVYRGHHDVMAEVELPAIVQQRPLDVGLHYESTIAAVWVFLSLLDDCFDLLESQAHLYAIATVAVLSGFDDPSVVLFDVAFLLTGFGDFFGPLVVVFQELKVLFILKTIFDMECKWEITKHIFFDFFVIVGHSIEEGFFVAKDVVINEMVVHFLFVYLADFHDLAIFEVLPSRGQSLVIALF